MTTKRTKNTKGSDDSVVVIGGGIVGGSVAFHLAKRGVRVTVIEAGEPGQVASRVSYAWINGRDKNPYAYHELNRRSQDMWRRFADDLQTDVGLVWGGEMRWTLTNGGAQEFRARVGELQSWGYAIRELPIEEARELEPGIAFGDATAVSVTESDGHVDAELVARACLSRVEALGGVVRTGEPVKGLVRDADGSVTHVLTEESDYPCSSVVLSAGAKTPELAAMVGLELTNNHSPGATVVTDRLDNDLFKSIVAMHSPKDADGELLNARHLSDGRVMLHGQTHDSREGAPEAAETLLEEAKQYLPSLSGLSVSEVRHTLRPMPPDSLPVVGHLPKAPNTYVAYTHSGVTLAPIIGEMAALEMAENSRVGFLAPFRPDRFGR